MTGNVIHLDQIRDALAESLSTPFRSFRPEVRVKGEWYPNAIRLRSETEANLYALDLMYRWSAVEKTRAIPSTDSINYEWRDNRLHPVKPGDV